MLITVEEQFLCRKIRVFRWNEKISRTKISDSQGLALFHIINSYTIFRRPDDDQGQDYQVDESDMNLHQKVVPFNLSELLAKDLDFGPNVVRATQLFFPDTEGGLGEQISNYLFSRFQFDDPNINILSPNSPNTVILVDVARFLKIWLDDNKDSNIENGEGEDEAEGEGEGEGEAEAEGEEEEEEEEDDHDLNHSMDVLGYLHCLRSYLGGANRRMRRPLTRDEARGLVEVSPANVLGKRKREFDRKLETCVICLDGFVGLDDDQISTTSCFHVFHRHCIEKWLLRTNSCPTCRLVMPLD